VLDEEPRVLYYFTSEIPRMVRTTHEEVQILSTSRQKRQHASPKYVYLNLLYITAIMRRTKTVIIHTVIIRFVAILQRALGQHYFKPLCLVEGRDDLPTSHTAQRFDASIHVSLTL
jgi:hypothetical protein